MPIVFYSFPSSPSHVPFHPLSSLPSPASMFLLTHCILCSLFNPFFTIFLIPFVSPCFFRPSRPLPFSSLLLPAFPLLFPSLHPCIFHYLPFWLLSFLHLCLLAFFLLLNASLFFSPLFFLVPLHHLHFPGSLYLFQEPPPSSSPPPFSSVSMHHLTPPPPLPSLSLLF